MFQVDVDYLKKAKKRKDHGKVVIIVFLTLAGAATLSPNCVSQISRFMFFINSLSHLPFLYFL